MPLSPATRLGPYEILAAIGAGGMGEVYRARDPRLGRDVALKVLPAAFASDAERMARFGREAQVLASLNHPNIASLYGLEESGGVRALVMELVEGPTLAQRIAAGPIPFDEALPIARQIAEALEAAHEKGIIHRDLKPANVKVTPDGTVKVLDFGLAKALDDTPASADPAHSPTMSLAGTRAGVILGTAAYMSPEQAKGKPVDRRADIWAFGVVLAEMLTGRQLYSGETAAETLAAVMKDEPSLGGLPSHTPATIRKLLRRCLEKDPRRRLRDVGEARIAIEEVLSGPPPEEAAIAVPPAAPTGVPAPSRLKLLWPVVAGLLLVATLALAFLYFRQTPPPERVVRFTVTPPPKAAVHTFMLSPDGRYLAIAVAAEGKSGLWIRTLDSLDLQLLPGTDGAQYPFWSPDSRFLGFFAQGKLKKIAVTGGPTQTLCDAADGRSGAWNRDGVIIFSPNPAGVMYRVASAGGVPAPATTLDASGGSGIHRFPVFLPDGRHFLFLTSQAQQEKSGIYLGSLDSKEVRRLLPDDSSVAYAPPSSSNPNGHLLFLRQGTLTAQPFDARRLETTGELFPVAEQVAIAANVNYGAFSVSQDGVLAYRTGGGPANRELTWFDRDGKRLGGLGEIARFGAFSFSPDQKRLAGSRFDLRSQTSDLWLHDLTRGTTSRFTFGPARNANPVWSPDGSRIVFASDREGRFNLYQKISSGAGKDELLFKSDADKRPMDWSRDGRFIVYLNRDPKTKFDLWLLPLNGDRKPIPFLQTEFDELDGQFSPDGRWMAYASNESGKAEVYIQPVPGAPIGPGAKWQVSTSGGAHPRWRRDGKELFYIAADSKLMAVTVQAGSTFEAGVPRPLFETRLPNPSAYFGGLYDIAADGRRFLVNTLAGEVAEAPITVIMNWVKAVGSRQ